MSRHRYEELIDVTEVSDLQTAAAKWCDRFSFDLFSAIWVSPEGAGSHSFVFFHNSPAEWDFFVPKDSLRDPVLNHIKSHSSPIAYSRKTYEAAGAVDLWEKQSPFGYKHGVANACHLGSGAHFAIGFDRETRLPSRAETLRYMLVELQHLTVCMCEALNQLSQIEKAQRHAVESAGARIRDDAKKISSLSSMEMQCLELHLCGFSSRKISSELCITDAAADFHLREIMRKVGLCPSIHAQVQRSLNLQAH